MSNETATWTSLSLETTDGKNQTTQFIRDIPNSAMIFIRISLMVVILMPLSVFGIVANIINICVYLKMKLNDSITVQLLALSISDLTGSILSLFISICFLILECGPPLTVDPYSLVYILAGGARAMFSEISLSITVFISLERCLGVIMPLTFRISVSPTVSIRMTSLIVIAVILCYIPIYSTRGLAWQFDRTTNSTRLLAFYTDERENVETFSTFFVNITWGTGAQITVLISTCVMIRGLKRASQFRLRSTRITKKGDLAQPQTTIRDRSIIRMVAVICWILIICSLPALSYNWARNFVSQLRSSKGYRNLTTTIFALANIGMCINASVNIFAYYRLGSKYRMCLNYLFLGVKVISVAIIRYLSYLCKKIPSIIS